VLHAPRQTGKTTFLHTLAADLAQDGQYTAVVTNVEFLQRVTDVEKGNLAILNQIVQDAQSQLQSSEEWPPSQEPFVSSPLNALNSFLSAWAAACPKPIVLFIDEIDSLPEDLLISVLRQLRTGYTARGIRPFIHSLALVGLRDVRDYKVKVRPDSESLGTASPFNIKAESLMLRNFTRDEVAELYAQHTEETGQVFETEAVERAFYWTQGQPWLVNALARQITWRTVPERTIPITAAHIDAAKDALILRRDTHLDSLADKLHEPRVRRVIEPILAGTMLPWEVMNDDLLYVRDLGLIVERPSVRIANPIYQEVIPRSLNYVIQVSITDEAAWYTLEDGTLDMVALLRRFQSFFAEHSEHWLGRYDYQEAGPHLILMAFLQRVINGGGSLHREFAVGSGRADLVLEWHGKRHVLELKVYRSQTTVEQGVMQLSGYLDRLGMQEGFLIIFDRRPERTWAEKLYEKEVEGPRGHGIHIFGM
jgi:hypothetical protein